MDKIRILPPDPVEAAQVPVEGVDLPAEGTAVEVEGESLPPADSKQPADFVENEGLTRKTTEAEDGQSADLEEAAEAALRGRTA